MGRQGRPPAQWREVLRGRLEVLVAAQQDDRDNDSHRHKADEGAAKGVLQALFSYLVPVEFPLVNIPFLFFSNRSDCRACCQSSSGDCRSSLSVERADNVLELE
jgi:hypothetical protein